MIQSFLFSTRNAEKSRLVFKQRSFLVLRLARYIRRIDNILYQAGSPDNDF
jgi:hypothetical protein